MDQVNRLLGTASDDRVAELAAAALEHDPKRALKLLAQAADEGLQLGELLDQLLIYWRDLMVVHAAGAEAPALSVSSKHKTVLAEQSRKVSLDTLLAGLDVLASTKARLRFSNHGRVLMEMALVRLGRLEDLVSVSQLAEALANGSRAAPAQGPAAADLSKKKTVTSAERGVGEVGAQARAAPAAPSPSTPTELNTHALQTLWPQVLAQAGQFLRANLEKSAFPAISGPNALVLRFPGGYNASRDRCQDPDNIARVERLLQQMTGQKIRLRIESDSAAVDDTASSVRIAEDPENSQSHSPPAGDEAAGPPLVQWAEDLLGARTIKADPGFGASAPASVARAEITDLEET